MMKQELIKFIHNFEIQNRESVRYRRRIDRFFGEEPNPLPIDLEHFFACTECDFFSHSCLFHWDTLLANTPDDSIKYCDICSQNLYKVNDVSTYLAYKKEKLNLAVSLQLFQNMQDKDLNREMYNLKKRIIAAHFLTVDRYYHSNIFANGGVMVALKISLFHFFSNKKTEEEILQEIALYKQHGVDFDFIINHIIPNMGEKLFEYFKNYL